MKPEQRKLLETSPVTCVHPYLHPTRYQGRPKQPPQQAVAAGVTTLSRSLPHQGALPGTVPPGPQSKSFSGFSVLASCLICVLTGLFLRARRSGEPMRVCRFTVEAAQTSCGFHTFKGECTAKTVSVKDPTMTARTGDSTHGDWVNSSPSARQQPGLLEGQDRGDWLPASH